MSIDLQGSLTLVGAGKMGSALLSGWVSGCLDPAHIQIVDPGPHEKALEIISTYSLSFNPAPSPSSIVVLAVKPQNMDEILSGLPGFFSKETLVISVAAGRTLHSLEQILEKECAVVRTMPNTPAEIGMGFTVACANSHVSEDQKKLCDKLLSAVGDVAWVDDEILMDAVTAVSGSGPAYVFHFVECLTEAGVQAGLETKLAEKLARATISGAGALLNESDLGASNLRENVTSPGGTTAAALEVLMSEDGLKDLINRAVTAAKQRSKDLSS